jgi:hypothetical protein
MCQAIPAGSTPLATAPNAGDPEWRGWWVNVPGGYTVDPAKPLKVIYNGAGCGDGNWFHAGADGLPYQVFDGGGAILVGLDYDTYSDVPGCYDDRNPISNDFEFFPWLQEHIEDEFCVDMNHEYFSGFSSGGWLAQQFNCAFPDRLRGEVAVTGCEPGAGVPGSQPPCVSKPAAMFYIHDYNDADNRYGCILPGCTRVLQQNGCSINGAPYACDPLNSAITTPYTLPAGFRPSDRRRVQPVQRMSGRLPRHLLRHLQPGSRRHHSMEESSFDLGLDGQSAGELKRWRLRATASSRALDTNWVHQCSRVQEPAGMVGDPLASGSLG